MSERRRRAPQGQRWHGCYTGALLGIGRRARLLKANGTGLFAKIGFIHLDDLAGAAHRWKVDLAAKHGLHNAMMEKPSRVVLAAKLAMELMR